MSLNGFEDGVNIIIVIKKIAVKVKHKKKKKQQQNVFGKIITSAKGGDYVTAGVCPSVCL